MKLEKRNGKDSEDISFRIMEKAVLRCCRVSVTEWVAELAL